ncbi:MAG: UDP-N-acetylmuramate dehydrogenase [Ruminococcaceae bacterium]|nr:UDP-N-acetylmuramate dehydrogenase [Oscillospiraceae bacterium]
MNKLINLLSERKIPFLQDEPMKNHTTFKTGGNASVFISPENEEQLTETLTIISSLGLRPFILGNGSNLLVSDDGIKDRPVIFIDKGFDSIELIGETTIKAGAGVLLTSLCRFAMENCLTGLEFAFGIPGSCGGAAFMNAGAYGGEMKDVVVSCNHMDFSGNTGSFGIDELDFGYRHSVYSDKDCVITSIVVKLEKGNKEEIQTQMKEFLQRRKDKQPLEYPSAGSVFKRPEGYYAGALIEQSGLKGKRIGGAMVSEKHAGFIINYDNATTKDVLDLVKFCQDTVMEKFGVMLEREIKSV